jgi:glucose-6-phosphate 1-dehydrogenase
MPSRQVLSPQDIVIFGGTGSLARLKLFPALYDLATSNLLPPKGQIIGLARTPMSEDAYRELARQSVTLHARHEYDEDAWQRLASRLRFVTFGEQGYDNLREVLTERERLVYLAVPPSAFGSTVRGLAASDLINGTRLLIEKPFGRDLKSAAALDAELREVLDESQIFRIDHYLGKETVQNILVFRFGNSVFERVWNRDAIEHIEITVAESDGVGSRGSFYEEVGALRDVVQNHMLQILSVLTMEPPASFDAEFIRDEKAKLLRAVRPLSKHDVVRGQYTRGRIEGQSVEAYAEEADVPGGTDVETYVATRLYIDNWRWSGIPIYMRTGKRLPQKATEIEIAFRDVPRSYFGATFPHDMEPNSLRLGIQPEEEISFSLLAKIPGQSIAVKPVTMSFSYDTSFTAEPAEAYERLIFDALHGDPALFVRSDSVMRAWEIVQPILDDPPPLHQYAAGTWGPQDANKLIAPDNWHLR